MYELTRPVRAGQPLIVVAVEEEAEFLETDLPILIAGLGKVHAATALAGALSGAERPSALLNLGTAGALKPGLEGTHEVGTVIQHDFDGELVFKLTGRSYGGPIVVGEGLTLATGDSFISDGPTRDRLARRADLVDMEGYAIASVAARLGIPARIVKHVSDEADENAFRTWTESVANCSRILSAWLAAHL